MSDFSPCKVVQYRPRTWWVRFTDWLFNGGPAVIHIAPTGFTGKNRGVIDIAPADSLKDLIDTINCSESWRCWVNEEDWEDD